MKCPICSAKISEIDAFCPNCGSAVKSETSGYMDSIDTSNLGENVGFGKRNTTGAQPVNAVPQQNYAQGQQSYGQPQNGYAQQSYPPPQNGNAQTPYGSAYEPYKIAPVTSAKKGIPKPLMTVLVFILAFLVAFGVRYFYKNTATKTLHVTKESINAAMKAATSESFGYNEDQIVSSDVIGMRYGSLFDATQTMVAKIDDDTYQVQVVSWYDNENSYTSQMVRTIKYFAENC